MWQKLKVQQETTRCSSGGHPSSAEMQKTVYKHWFPSDGRTHTHTPTPTPTPTPTHRVQLTVRKATNPAKMFHLGANITTKSSCVMDQIFLRHGAHFDPNGRMFAQITLNLYQATGFCSIAAPQSAAAESCHASHIRGSIKSKCPLACPTIRVHLCRCQSILMQCWKGHYPKTILLIQVRTL